LFVVVVFVVVFVVVLFAIQERRERSKILEKDDEKTDPRGWNARRAFRIEITTRDENKSVARVESENLRRELSLPDRRVRCRARARARG
jgi:hypothetical protein